MGRDDALMNLTVKQRHDLLYGTKALDHNSSFDPYAFGKRALKDYSAMTCTTTDAEPTNLNFDDIKKTITDLNDRVEKERAEQTVTHAKCIAWLKDFEICEPIKSWLEPEIKIHISDGFAFGLYIDIHVISINTDKPKGTKEPFKLRFRRSAPTTAVECKEVFFELLRHALHEVVTHEVDEAIRVDGKKVYDPHV